MLRAYVRLLCFAAGLLAGVQVPGFVRHYEVVVNAHLAEARRALAPFAGIAARHFGGDLDRLIAHYVRNPDAVIGETGAGVASLAARVVHLEAERSALLGPWYQSVWHVVVRSDRELLRETTAGYDYQVPLQPSAIAWGLGTGLGLALLIESIAGLVGAGARRGAAPRRAEKPSSLLP